MKWVLDNALLAYIDAHPEDELVVIVDDISRLARDMKVHIELRQALTERKVTLESPNFKFEDNPEGLFIEHVIAAKSQLDREQNRRQVIQKQKARFEQGYWPFCYPPGFINIKDPLHGKILVPHEPKAGIFKTAIENYRDGVLNTLDGVRDFINAEYKRCNVISKPISRSGAQKVLSNVLYAGFIEYEPWGIPLKKAQHEGFISKETFDVVQEKLKQKARATIRKDVNLDFPLRGFVDCPYCQKSMTGSWHKGRSQHYAHYFCKQRGCPGFGKTIRKNTIEGQFEALISGVTPQKDMLALVKAVLIDVWSTRSGIEEENKALSLKEVDQLESQMKHYVDRIGKTTNDDVILRYEQELEILLKRKRDVESSLPFKVYTPENFGTACDMVLTKIEKPVLMWQSDVYTDKRLLLEMYFDEKLTYDRTGGFGTATLACLPKLLCRRDGLESNLVESSERRWQLLCRRKNSYSDVFNS